MAQKQRERAPAGLAEAEQQSASAVLRHRIVLFKERQHDLEKVRLLSNLRVGRMVRVPRQLAERHLDADDAELVVQVVLLDFHEPIAILLAVARLNGQDEEDRIAFALLHAIGQKHLDLRDAALILRHHAMAQKTMLIRARLWLDLGAGDGGPGDEWEQK
jgi:hypothetical protein